MLIKEEKPSIITYTADTITPAHKTKHGSTL
jgi:hypothetical protein